MQFKNNQNESMVEIKMVGSSGRGGSINWDGGNGLCFYWGGEYILDKCPQVSQFIEPYT